MEYFEFLKKAADLIHGRLTYCERKPSVSILPANSEVPFTSWSASGCACSGSGATKVWTCGKPIKTVSETSNSQSAGAWSKDEDNATITGVKFISWSRGSDDLGGWDNPIRITENSAYIVGLDDDDMKIVNKFLKTLTDEDEAALRLEARAKFERFIENLNAVETKYGYELANFVHAQIGGSFNSMQAMQLAEYILEKSKIKNIEKMLSKLNGSWRSMDKELLGFHYYHECEAAAFSAAKWKEQQLLKTPISVVFGDWMQKLAA
jgi:hypothetical protein